jgi:hypothetical protein
MRDLNLCQMEMTAHPPHLNSSVIKEFVVTNGSCTHFHSNHHDETGHPTDRALRRRYRRVRRRFVLDQGELCGENGRKDYLYQVFRTLGMFASAFVVVSCGTIARIHANLYDTALFMNSAATANPWRRIGKS